MQLIRSKNISEFCRRWLPSAIGVASTLFAAVADACPNCKEGLATGGAQAKQLALGFELSIYVMLGTPLLIFGTLCTLFYLQIRRAQKHPEMWLAAGAVLPNSSNT